VLAPGRGVALGIDLEHGEVRHEAVRGSAMPMLLARLEEHPVAWANLRDRSTAPLHAADPLGDVDGLAVREAGVKWT
jgi:hypothetical protein